MRRLHNTMAPPLKPPKNVKKARAGGLQPLTDFFRRKNNGRPKKSHQQGQAKTSIKKKKRGPVTGSKNPPTTVYAFDCCVEGEGIVFMFHSLV